MNQPQAPNVTGIDSASCGIYGKTRVGYVPMLPILKLIKLLPIDPTVPTRPVVGEEEVARVA